MKIRLSFVSLALLATLSLGATAKSWRFVVAGDGRMDPGGHRTEDVHGVNSKIVAEIAKATVREHAKMLLYTGDLIYGGPKGGTLEQQYKEWLSLMQPVLKANIKLLPVRGNHEVPSNGEERSAAESLWRNLIAKTCGLPENGPDGEKGFTFSYTYDNTTVVAVDEYLPGRASGDRVSVNQPWMDALLASSKSQHIFPFAHEMAFVAGHHTDMLGENKSARDIFWQSLEKAGVHAVFFGHDHFYDRMAVTPASGGGAIMQYVAGTAGAPFYDDKGYGDDEAMWKRERKKHINKTFGYLLVEIDGPSAKITFKGRDKNGDYIPMDIWSYKSTRR